MKQRLIGSVKTIEKIKSILNACTIEKNNLTKANANRDKLSISELMDAVEKQMIPLSDLYDLLMALELVEVNTPMVNEEQKVKALTLPKDIPNPRYHHDCIHCVYLGQIDNFDLYYCPQGGKVPTVIAKHGDDEYLSGINSDYYALVEAQRLAVERGLINEDGTIKG